MKCPECNSKDTRVSTTEGHEKFTKRYCKCLNCGAKFRTLETYINTKVNRGKKKNSFILDDYQCQMIKKNRYMLSNNEWATICKVSLSTIVTAKTKVITTK